MLKEKMRGFLLRDIQRHFLSGTRIGHHTKFLSGSANNTNSSKALGEAKSVRDLDAYKKLENLDFMTAAKMLFTEPPKKKKFGLDFHLVQLFFCCMPPLAVYLVAQYARYEIKKMEAEREVKKKKAEEEEKAEVMKALTLEEERRKNDPELLQVKARLDAIEDALKGIRVESKKPSSPNLNKDLGNTEKEKLETVRPKSGSRTDDNSTAVDDKHLPRATSGPSKPSPTPKNEGKPGTSVEDQTDDPRKRDQKRESGGE
ncbi:hypothetical protein AQUCO_01600159v1 [Aquilegia coerulea]|uniref:Uncharacterized protein n=1 Tax=Aquilegia coerulea TaxID=218851 RepID=A0A2G5DQC9_AQUCA|nr:hypothetical protein AQUCO_01600159v1 [Aquilegia coerulea]